MPNPEHVDKLRRGVALWNKWRADNPRIIPDLSGEKFGRLNLKEANLSQANLIQAEFSWAFLFKADLSEANLRYVDLSRANFEQANLFQADLRGASLSMADFSEADLRRADLRDAKLRKGILRKANLNRANLIQANLREANLNGTDLRKANLMYAILSETNLIRANLSQANLREANLTGTDLRGAILNKADLSEAKLRWANLIGTDLSEANLSEAEFRKTRLIDADLSKTDLSGSDLRESLLIRSNLKEATITGARLYGSSREDWAIDGVKCDYVYWDIDEEIRTPKLRDFRPGEFEELYKQLPTIEYAFEEGITPFDLVVMGKVVDEINQQNPEYELVFDSLQSRGGHRAEFTIKDKKYAENVKRSIKRNFETDIAVLEGQKDALMSVISEFTRKKTGVTHVEGRYITMGDQITTTGQTGDIVTARDQATVNIQKISNPAVKDLIEQIGMLIQSESVSDDDKTDAQQQLSNMAKELEKLQPEKGRLKRFYDRMIDVIPKIAEKLPWDKIAEKLFMG